MTTISPDMEKKPSIQIHGQLKQIYDPYMIPPDWELAQHHALAAFPGHEKPTEKLTCPCCLNAIYKNPISLWQDNKQLAFLGQGFPLFFNFIKFCMIILGLIILDSCAEYLLINSQTNKCQIKYESQSQHRRMQTTHCQDNFYNDLANISSQPVTPIQTLLKIVSFIAQLFVLLYFRQQQSNMASYLDQRNTTISDYSILIQNIPLELNNYKQKLTNLIHKLDSTLQIKELLIIEDMKEYYVLQKKLQNLIQQKKLMIFNSNSNDQMQQIDQRFKKLQSQLVQLGHYMESKQNLYFIGSAYIVMNTQTQKDKLLQLLNQVSPQVIKQFFQNYNQKQKLICSEANQPRQINWQNIHYTKKQRIIGTLGGWIIFIILLGMITVGFFFIIKQKSKLILNAQQHYKENPEKYRQILKGGIALGYILVIIINILNKFGLSHLAHYITDKQRHIHFSDLQYSFAMKYMLSMFFTTALMTLIVEAIVFSNYTNVLGVIQQQTFMFIFNAIFSPLMWLINPYYLNKYIKRKLNYGVQNITQKQANYIMQYPSYDIGKRYAQILKTMWFTFLYVQIIPIGTVFSLAGLLLYYTVDKYVLLRRSSVKQSISSELSKSMVKILQFTLILKPIGQLVFESQLKSQFPLSSLIMFIIGVVYLLLPLQKILKIFFQQQFKPQQKTFDQVKQKFNETYLASYPLRKHENHLKHISNRKIIFKTQTTLYKNQATEQNFNINLDRMVKQEKIVQKDQSRMKIRQKITLNSN